MLLCAHGAFAALFGNHADAAEPYVARMDALHNPAREVDSVWYYNLLAGRYFLQNDLPRSRQYLEQAVRSCRETAFVIGEALCLNDLARVTYYQGEHQPALDLLQKARQAGRNLRSHLVEYLTWLTEAEFALLAGDETACLQAMRRGLAIGRQQRFHNHHWWRGELMARLYARALEHGIEAGYVLGMIRRRALPPPEEARESDAWPFPYKIYTLGRFALVKDGQPLAFAGRAQSKPLELLKAVIALGGRQVNAAHLGGLLWPDADGDAAQRAFDTTLHRLRRLLGHEQALILSDGKLSLNPAVCWVDAWVFERLMGRLDLFLKQSRTDAEHRDTIADLAARLAAIHRGPFLGRDQQEGWAIAPRERLHNRMLFLLGALGRYWESAGDWERAADIYHKAIDVHDQVEENYQRLMQAYQHLRRPAEAAAVYQRCRETLLATTGRPPSPVTEALYRQLAVSS
jgi:DNA-binding SARP family transcriptional activator